jgi:aerobic carbon-monoxide dehydrogenase small subunit
MNKEIITFNLNGEKVEVLADPFSSLLQILRDELGLYGTKEGCGKGECGACTVLLDDLAVNSCLIPVGKVMNRAVLTIEALADGSKFHPLQEAFIEKGAVQCGFCSPGMIMSAYALLKNNPDPTNLEVKTAISGNLCRCSGYKQIEEAVLAAAVRIRSERKSG